MTLTANTVECFKHPSTKSGATSCDGRDEEDLESTQTRGWTTTRPDDVPVAVLSGG